MRIAIAIKVQGNGVEDVQVFKSFDAACKSVEDNDHDWDDEPHDLPETDKLQGRLCHKYLNGLLGRVYPTVEGEWHVQEIEVPE